MTEMEQKPLRQEAPHRVNQRHQNALIRGIVGGVIGGVVTITLVGGVLWGSGLIAFKQHQPNSETPSSAPVTQQAISQTERTTSHEEPTTQAVTAVQDAVVSVVNRQARGTNLGGLQVPGGTTTDADAYQTTGEGSGVVYQIKEGAAYIVTNHHVIDGADDLEVILRDGTVVKAELVGSDMWTDLAVLKTDGTTVKQAATFANSDDITVGETVLAIGSPLGSEFATSVTRGIVSAKERSVSTDLNQDGEPDWTMTAIQTDAAINPGNSGGALVNLVGHVIGINSMKISSTTVEGIGFAIPSNEVKDIIAELEQTGQITRPYLGINMVNVSAVSARDRSRVLSLPNDVTSGVVVTNVVNRALGLQQYDVIVAWDDQPIDDTIGLRKQLYHQQVGDTVTLTLYREGTKQTMQVTLGSTGEQ